MENKRFLNILFFVVFLAVLLEGKKSNGQISGSLFMDSNNFYAQMYNPAYARNDNAISFSIAGMAGFSFMNQGNFKIGDLITVSPSGNPVIDFDHFFEHSKSNNIIMQDFSLPVLFFSVPLKNGNFSFYYKENINALSKVKQEVFEFLTNGNFPTDFRNFNSGEVKLSGLGYREFAFGYSKPLNNTLVVGVRTKLLFGAVMANTSDWNYGLETATTGSEVILLSGGRGRVMFPLPYILRDDKTMFSVDADNAAMKYLFTYKNPGFAIDLGINWQISKEKLFSAAIRDIGGIWFRYNALNMEQNEPYDFVGFDLVSAIRYPEESESSVKNEKEKIRLVYQPVFTETTFAYTMTPKSMLHFQYQYSDLLSFGLTNQTAFHKNYVQNILTASVMQKWPSLSVFENINMQGFSGLTVGGGMQYETHSLQLFMATDNLVTFYHPAATKTFSLTAGICLLLNKEDVSKSKKSDKSDIKRRRGTISEFLPFYKKFR